MAATDVLTEKPRISSIDLMRGIVMVIMALDHTRDFFHIDAYLFDPTNLERTNPLLFFTRIITHYCAPTFVLLSGVSIRISQQRKTSKELSLFLLTRGLWLLLLEMTVIRFSFLFQWYYDVTIFQVIWAIGISMVFLSALVYLPFRIIIALGFVIVISHNLLDAIQLQPGNTLFYVWSFIHQPSFGEIVPGRSVFVIYPMLSWLGIMLLGYGLGEWYTKRFDSSRRKKLLVTTGVLAIIAFVILRYFNIYGDPTQWSQQKNVLFTFMSFINVTKYPASLQFTLMTLGPVMLLLALMENINVRALNPFVIFGRVPLLYYILHFYIIHLAALICYIISSGKALTDLDFHFSTGFGGIPPGNGYNLFWVYVAWISIIIALYPVCKWYNHYKSTHKQWWLSYL